MMERIIETNSAQETCELGKRIAAQMKPGSVYTLEGDLGTGKTVFAKGAAEGLGIEEDICSPTFTIMQVYEDGRLPLYRFDLYRIGDPEELDEFGFDDYLFGNGVCLIEWPQSANDRLPASTVRIRLEKNADKGFDYRRITISE